MVSSSSEPWFGAHGIVYDGANAMYVGNSDRSSLARVPINADGSAGTPVAITVSPPLDHPESIVALDPKTLVITETATNTVASGRLSTLRLDGDKATSTPIRNDLRNPTAMVRVNGSYWVNELQLVHLLDPSSGPPVLPFRIQRITAE